MTNIHARFICWSLLRYDQTIFCYTMCVHSVHLNAWIPEKIITSGTTHLSLSLFFFLLLCPHFSALFLHAMFIFTSSLNLCSRLSLVNVHYHPNNCIIVVCAICSDSSARTKYEQCTTVHYAPNIVGQWTIPFECKHFI